MPRWSGRGKNLRRRAAERVAQWEDTRMAYPIVACLILSLVVRYWPGQPAPVWVNTWIDRLWLLFGVIFGLGVVLAFFNTATTELPNGGFRYEMSTPKQIQYALAAAYVPLTILALVGAGYVIRSGVNALSHSLSQDAGKARFRKVSISLGVALAAVVVSWAFGGPLTFSTEKGSSSIVPLAIDVAAGIVFFAALVSAWSAATAPAEKQ